jgi:hypothetical protein
MYRILVWAAEAILVILLPIVVISLIRGPVKTEAAWYNETWPYRQKLTIDHTKVSGGADLSSFPVLVSLTDVNITRKSQSNGNDILFTDSTGSTKLDHEIEKFNSSTGQIVVWVRIPTLHFQTDDVIYMYYGNPSVASQQNKTGVWDANYLAVYHLNETSGHHLDSKNSNNSTAETSLVSQGTAIGMAGGADEFNGSSSIVDLPIIALGGKDGTIEAWGKSDVTTGNTHLVGRYWESQSLRTQAGIYNGNISPAGATSDWSSNVTTNWTYWAINYDGTLPSNNSVLYINGTQIGTANATGNIDNEDQVWQIGSSGNSNENWDGILDEVRLSSTSRSVGWIATTYNTINSPSTFFSGKGSEEKVREPVLNFKFDEGSGTTTTDSSPAKIVGTFAGVVNKPTWQTEDMCVSGKCLNFEGSNANLTVSTTINNVRSISFWEKNASSSGTIPLMKLTSGANISITSGTTVAATGFTSPTVYVNGVAKTSVSPNVWNHVEVVDTAGTSADAIVLGTINSATYFKGFLDEVKFFDYGRTAAQVKLDYNSKAAAIPRGGGVNISGQTSDALTKGLVGYWKMDEATWSGTLNEVVDSSGIGNHGTAQGATGGKAYPTGGKFGNGGYFDGVDDYVSTSTTHVGQTPGFTISAWYKTTVNNSNTKTIYSEGNTGNDSPKVELFVMDNVAYFQYRDNSNNQAEASYSNSGLVYDGNWHHIVAVNYASNKSVLYYDGLLVSTSTANVSGVSLNSSAIGAIMRTTTTHNFSGSVDDVRVYNRTLSQVEVSQLYNWAPGPVGWWKMDEGSWNGTADEVKDSSGNNLNGVSSGGATTTNGKYGKAGNFKGDAGGVIVGNPVMLQNPYAGSVGAWIYLRSWMNGYPNFVGKDDSSDWKHIDWGMSTYGSAGSPRFYTYISAGTGYTPGTDFASTATPVGSVNYNQWYHLEMTWEKRSDGKTYINCYLNGSLSCAGNNMTGTMSTTHPLYFGKYMSDASLTTDAIIDDVRIYNYVRTPSQIVEDMNAGHSVPGSPVGSAIGYWKFNEGYGDTAYNSGAGGSVINGDLAGSGTTCPQAGDSACPIWTNNGKFGKALIFGTGTTKDYIQVPYNIALNPTTAITLSAWVKTTETALRQYVIQRIGGNPYPGYSLTIGATYCGIAGEVGLWVGDGTNNYLCTTKTVNDGSWHHILGTYDGTTAYIYIDGKQAASGARTNGLANASTALQIGGYTAGSYYFNGGIDEVKIYDFFMTADQVKEDYNQGKSQVLGSLSDTSQLTGGSVASTSASAAYCVPGSSDTCVPPVGEWKLDENIGNNVYDSSGNGNNSSGFYSSPAWVNGKYGSGLSFHGDTGDGQRVVINDSPSLHLSNFSLEAWVKPNATNISQALISKRSSYSTMDWQFWLGSDGNINLAVGESAAGYALSTCPYTAGSWIHLVATKNGNSYILYKNGVQCDSGNNATTWTDSDNIALGAISDGTEGGVLNGVLDDVRIYNYARTPAQVAWDYNRGAPIAWYKFDECAGTTAHNSALDANGNALGMDGSISSAAGRTAGICGSGTSTEMWNGGTSGKYSGSLKFIGSWENNGDAVTISAPDKLKLTSGGTFAVWIKPHSEGGDYYGRIIDKSSNTNGADGYIMLMNGGPSIGVDIDGWGCSSSENSVPFDQWTQVVWTFDGSVWKIYINGVLNNNNNCEDGTKLPPDTSLDVNIGSRQGARDRGFDGQIDDLRIYNYALTAAQVKLLYNQNSAVNFGQ